MDIFVLILFGIFVLYIAIMASLAIDNRVKYYDDNYKKCPLCGKDK